MKTVKLLVATLSLCLVLMSLLSCDFAETFTPTPPTDDSSNPDAIPQGTPSCEHSWVEATCQSPKTCSKCSATEGGAKEHTWVDATCQTPKTCSACSTTEGSALSDHNYQNGACTYCNQADPKESEFAAANTAYSHLIQAHEVCSTAMGTIYNAWYFGIYEGNDYSASRINSCMSSFASEIGVDTELVKRTVTTMLQDMGMSDPTDFQKYVLFSSFDLTIAIAQEILQSEGIYDIIDTHLAEAKDALKSVTNAYSDYTGYPALKSYYSEISAYLEFCKSPSGSFSQLSGTIDKYETNLRNYKNDLGFIFD